MVQKPLNLIWVAIEHFLLEVLNRLIKLHVWVHRYQRALIRCVRSRYFVSLRQRVKVVERILVKFPVGNRELTVQQELPDAMLSLCRRCNLLLLRALCFNVILVSGLDRFGRQSSASCCF